MLDVVSHEAYSEHGVRTGIYSEDFNVFLPIAIDASHFHQAQTILKDSLMNIHQNWVRNCASGRFAFWMFFPAS